MAIDAAHLCLLPGMFVALAAGFATMGLVNAFTFDSGRICPIAPAVFANAPGPTVRHRT